MNQRDNPRYRQPGRGGVSIKKRKKKKSQRTVIARFLSVLFILAFFLVIMYLAARLFFRVGAVRAEGALLYSGEEIAGFSGISEGVFMYAIDKKQAADSILENCPYIKSVYIDRKLPDTVVIRTEEEKAAFYISRDGENLLLSESMRVLEVTKKKLQGVAFAYLPDIKRGIEGEKAEFSAAKTDYIAAFIGALSEQLEKGAVTEIDARDKYNLKAVFEGRYTVKFGNTQELANKINVALAIMATGEVKSASGAVIDVNDPAESGVTLIGD